MRDDQITNALKEAAEAAVAAARTSLDKHGLVYSGLVVVAELPGATQKVVETGSWLSVRDEDALHPVVVTLQRIITRLQSGDVTPTEPPIVN